MSNLRTNECQSLINGTSLANHTKENFPIKKEERNDLNTEITPPKNLIPPWRTCIALCLAYGFTYSAFEAIQNLQSSLNAAGHLGEMSLSIMYASMLLGSLFGPVCARLIGHKGILCLGYLGHLCYTCSNFIPSWATLLPVSAAGGISIGGLGMSRSVYITAMSTSYIYYKKLPKTKLYGTISFFNGIFYCSFKATQITGNLMSSVILQSKTYNETLLTENKCGVRVCSSFNDSLNFDRPSTQLLNILFGSFTFCNIMGLAIIAIGLPHLKITSSDDKAETMKNHALSCLSMMINPKFVVLIPSIMAQSIMLMVTYTGYTKAFVSCAVGVQWVGYSMVALGIVSSITALTANYLVRYTGRILQFATGMGIDIATIVILLVWEPDYRTSPSVLLIVPMIAGFAQGILQPQQQALIGGVFSTEQLPSAYAAAYCVKSLAYFIFLCVASTACLYHGIILTLALYMLGLMGYAYTEIRERKEGKERA